MGEFPFTQVQVDELVQKEKYVLSVPRKEKINNKIRMGCSIFLEKECKIDIKLGIEVNIAIDSLFREEIRPSGVLIWHGQDVRRINWKLQKRNANGENIENWHEHIWRDEERMGFVVPIEINNPSIEEFFLMCLERWNIKIVGEVQPMLIERIS